MKRVGSLSHFLREQTSSTFTASIAEQPEPLLSFTANRGHR